ncbi:MAG: hypothetical protein HKN86_05475 [Acidimicrobiia bacterium]|nr:hypothetical protein [Acidimicrobiia bacterium]
MVHLEEITNMVDNNLEDFYNDRDRFKGFKLLVDFDEAKIPDEPETPDMEFSKPKFKKRQITSKHIKSNPNKKSLF